MSQGVLVWRGKGTYAVEHLRQSKLSSISEGCLKWFVDQASQQHWECGMELCFRIAVARGQEWQLLIASRCTDWKANVNLHCKPHIWGWVTGHLQGFCEAVYCCCTMVPTSSGPKPGLFFVSFSLASFGETRPQHAWASSNLYLVGELVPFVGMRDLFGDIYVCGF